jgi:hypothetical protein
MPRRPAGAGGLPPPPAVVFCDFDGTITVEGTLDCLVDRAMGRGPREAISYREMLATQVGLYPIVTFQYSLTTLYQFSYHIR